MPAVAVVLKNWTNWKKMEIARTPVGEKVTWHGGARQAATAGKNSMTQRNVRDPSVRLFVNEGDETG